MDHPERSAGRALVARWELAGESGSANRSAPPSRRTRTSSTRSGCPGPTCARRRTRCRTRRWPRSSPGRPTAGRRSTSLPGWAGTGSWTGPRRPAVGSSPASSAGWCSSASSGPGRAARA
ncbi:hypothetical protein NKH77_49030 [Streptomyces sp. M19]